MTDKRYRLRWIAGVTWALSWFELYLEVVRFRHVALPAFLGFDAAPLHIGPEAQPGAWLRTDLACAAIAPVAFFALAAIERWQAPTRELKRVEDERRPLLAVTLVAVGLLIGSLGLANQFVRRPPFVVDLTLRQGNGGFIVLGGCCALLGGALMRRSVTAPRTRSAMFDGRPRLQ